MSNSGTGDVEDQFARIERLTRAIELLAQREGALARRRKDWDAYAAVIASFIGLLALAVAAYTAYVQRQQLRAQVWPHLVLWESDTNPGLYLTNQGTGPAVIVAARVTVDGTPIKTWEDLRTAVGYTDNEGMTRSSIRGTVLPPGKDYSILQPADNDPSRERFRKLVYQDKHKFQMVICYCSILDECRTAGFGGVIDDDQPHARDACPILPAERFND